MKRKMSAFTLAEVLITLGVIGIVAAMTLPTLKLNYEKRYIQSRIKKAYSILKQGFIASQNLNAEFETWNFDQGAESFYKNYMEHYFVEDDRFKVEDLERYSITYHNMDGTLATEPVLKNDNSVVLMLTDSTMIFVSDERNDAFKTLAVDINGLNRPNIIGKDTFIFSVQGKYGVMPYGFANAGNQSFGTQYNDDELLNSTPYGCRHSGAYCTAYLMSHAWDMDKDYPR